MWEQLNRIMQERNLNGHQLSKMAGVNRSLPFLAEYMQSR